MEEERIIDQVAEPAAETEPAPKKRSKRRTKEELEADAQKAAGEALETVANVAKQAVEEGAQVAGRVAKPRIPVPEIVVQYSGAEIDASTLTEAAVAQFRTVKKRTGIKDIKLYVKPEERAVYYVINGDFTGKVDF